MSNENSGSGYAGAILFAAGTLFGAFLVYLVLKNKEPQIPPPPAPTLPPQYIAYVPQCISQPVPPQPVTPPAPVVPALPVPLQVPQAPVLPIPPISPEVSGYRNNEEWLLDYDEEGFIKSIKVIRDAKCLIGIGTGNG